MQKEYRIQMHRFEKWDMAFRPFGNSEIPAAATIGCARIAMKECAESWASCQYPLKKPDAFRIVSRNVTPWEIEETL